MALEEVLKKNWRGELGREDLVSKKLEYEKLVRCGKLREDVVVVDLVSEKLEQEKLVRCRNLCVVSLVAETWSARNSNKEKTCAS